MDARAVALVCLTVIVLAAIAGLTITAVFTDRDLHDPETFTLAIALCVAVLGGVNSFRRHYRWRIEREEADRELGE